MATIKWKEDSYLKCEITTSTQHLFQATFIIIDESGNEYEISAPVFSFNPIITTSSPVSKTCGKITRVGQTGICWNGERLCQIGQCQIVWSGNKIMRIGKTAITWNGDKLCQIGHTQIVWSGNSIMRIGRATIYSNGSVSGSVK